MSKELSEALGEVLAYYADRPVGHRAGRFLRQHGEAIAAVVRAVEGAATVTLELSDYRDCELGFNAEGLPYHHGQRVALVPVGQEGR